MRRAVVVSSLLLIGISAIAFLGIQLAGPAIHTSVPAVHSSAVTPTATSNSSAPPPTHSYARHRQLSGRLCVQSHPMMCLPQPNVRRCSRVRYTATTLSQWH